MPTHFEAACWHMLTYCQTFNRSLIWKWAKLTQNSHGERISLHSNFLGCERAQNFSDWVSNFQRLKFVRQKKPTFRQKVAIFDSCIANFFDKTANFCTKSAYFQAKWPSFDMKGSCFLKMWITWFQHFWEWFPAHYFDFFKVSETHSKVTSSEWVNDFRSVSL